MNKDGYVGPWKINPGDKVITIGNQTILRREPTHNYNPVNPVSPSSKSYKGCKHFIDGENSLGIKIELSEDEMEEYGLSVKDRLTGRRL
ncbi:hypothetical protein HYZ41_01035 [archaeon]|nr:hypothetical protein [archaeon]